MFFDASLVITFGLIVRSGTNKMKAVKDGKEIEFAKRTRISCDKNHITGITAVSKIIMTTHGFIHDTPDSINKYKKQHSHEWVEILGGKNFEIVEEDDATSTVDIFAKEDGESDN